MQNHIELTQVPCLRKDLWVEILDYLDTMSYFKVIPQLNSFFYFLVKEYKNYRTTLNLKLDVDETNSYITFRGITSKDSNCLEIILNTKLLKKLELKLLDHNKNLIDVPILTFTDCFALMKNLSNLKVLKIDTTGKIFWKGLLSFLENLKKHLKFHLTGTYFLNFHTLRINT